MSQIRRLENNLCLPALAFASCLPYLTSDLMQTRLAKAIKNILKISLRLGALSLLSTASCVFCSSQLLELRHSDCCKLTLFCAGDSLGRPIGEQINSINLIECKCGLLSCKGHGKQSEREKFMKKPRCHHLPRALRFSVVAVAKVQARTDSII